jgi:hypothetical protein
MIMGQEIPIESKVEMWLGTLKQHFFLNVVFCLQSTNVAYESCYFPQMLLSGKNVAK